MSSSGWDIVAGAEGNITTGFTWEPQPERRGTFGILSSCFVTLALCTWKIVHLNLPGEGNAGSLVASALEGSTTDTATEFNKMIIAQQAYSAASQVISATSDMFDTLIQAVR